MITFQGGDLLLKTHEKKSGKKKLFGILESSMYATFYNNQVDEGVRQASSIIQSLSSPGANVFGAFHNDSNNISHLGLSGQSLPKLSPSPGKRKSERSVWTPEEDNLLRYAVQLYGDKTEKWAKIASHVPGRTNKNCRKRWFHSLDPTLRKGPWTPEEDEMLRNGVTLYNGQWSKIAEDITGRTDDQCAKRWRESLDPAIDRAEWTPEEDEMLLQKFEEMGSQWQKIAQHFPGRPGLHCRNRWRKIQRSLSQSKREREKREEVLTSLTPTTESSDKATPLLTPDNLAISQFPVNDSTPEPPVEMEIEDPSSKPYGCGVSGCQNSYPNSSGLFYHMKASHAGVTGAERPYKCSLPGCTKRYKNINGLQYHIVYAKGSSGHQAADENDEQTNIEKPFKCSIPGCRKSYRNPNGLQYHLAHAHISTAPNSAQFHPTSNTTQSANAPICPSPNVPYNTDGLVETLNQQSPVAEKPYKCTVSGCNKGYLNANRLSNHTRNDHPELNQLNGLRSVAPLQAQDAQVCGDRAYKCLVKGCGKGYVNIEGLKNHLLHTHASTPEIADWPAIRH